MYARGMHDPPQWTNARTEKMIAFYIELRRESQVRGHTPNHI